MKKFIIPVILLAISLTLFIIYKDSIFGICRHPYRYSEYVGKYSKLYNVDKNLVYAIIKTESKFYPFAKSRANSRGLMQISEDTFEHSKSHIQVVNDDIYHKEANIQVGIWYLSYLIDMFKDERYAIIAYNAGPQNILDWINKGFLKVDNEYTSWNIPYVETRVYIDRVLKSKKYYSEK